MICRRCFVATIRLREDVSDSPAAGRAESHLAKYYAKMGARIALGA
jgi:hypothetical protein